MPKHPIAEAVNYALNQWNDMSVFTTDGAVLIDNNVSEREMKRKVAEPEELTVRGQRA